MRWIPKLAALVLAGAATLAAADVYRFVDADGRVHYSDPRVPGSQLVHVDRHHPAEEEGAARVSGDQAKLQASNNRIAEDQKQASGDRACRSAGCASRAREAMQGHQGSLPEGNPGAACLQDPAERTERISFGQEGGSTAREGARRHGPRLRHAYRALMKSRP